METTAVRKILIVVLDNLGDAVMATALFKPLKRIYPHAQVGLWTKNYVGDLFKDQSLLDFHHQSDPFWDKAPGHNKGHWKAFWRTFLEVRRSKYDMAFILNSEWRRAGFVWLAGIRDRVGLNRRKSRFFLTRAVPPAKSLQHFINEHLSLLPETEFTAQNKIDCLPRLELNTEEKKLWDQWHQESKWGKGSFVVVHPFSGDEKKNWPLSCWSELIQKMLTENKSIRFLVLCGPGEESRLEQLVSNLPSAPIQILSRAKLSKVKAILAHSMLVIDGDSGPGHVAAALGIPLLSLFGYTSPERSCPKGYGPIHIIHKNPIHTLSVGEVGDQMVKMLESLGTHA